MANLGEHTMAVKLDVTTDLTDEGKQLLRQLIRQELATVLQEPKILESLVEHLQHEIITKTATRST
jgi:hypothetical protein